MAQAFFAFTDLLRLDSGFQCSVCSDRPKVVVADGTAHSFQRKHLTQDLRPPSFVDYSDPFWPQVDTRMVSKTSQAFVPRSDDRKCFQQYLASTTGISLPGEVEYQPLRPMVILCLGQGLKGSSTDLQQLLLVFLKQVSSLLPPLNI